MIETPPLTARHQPELPAEPRRRPARVAIASISLVLLLLVAGCGGDDGDAAGAEWTSFTDEASSLTVDLPGEPETQELDAPAGDGTTIDARLHMVEFGDSAVALGIFELPANQFNLEGSVDGAAANINGEVIETSPSTAGDYEALDAEISFLDGDGVGFYRVTHLDDQQIAVQLQSIGRASDRDAVREAFDKLAASFNP